jgi:hypothetical protein
MQTPTSSRSIRALACHDMSGAVDIPCGHAKGVAGGGGGGGGGGVGGGPFYPIMLLLAGVSNCRGLVAAIQ